MKARAGIYINNNINYELKEVLEGRNNGLLIIELKLKKKNVYRFFNPTDGRSQKQYFIDQLTRIKTVVELDKNRLPIIVGDFNLDEKMKYNINYALVFNAIEALVMAMETFGPHCSLASNIIPRTLIVDFVIMI